MFRIALILIFLASSSLGQEADTPEKPMTYERLGRIIFALDPEASPQGSAFVLTVLMSRCW